MGRWIDGIELLILPGFPGRRVIISAIVTTRLLIATSNLASADKMPTDIFLATLFLC